MEKHIRAIIGSVGVVAMIGTLYACVPTRSTDYEVCNTDGCGDNVVIVIDNQN